MPALVFYLYFGQFRPIFYNPCIFKTIPALLPFQQNMTKSAALNFLCFSPDPDAINSVRNYILNESNPLLARLGVNVLSCTKNQDALPYLIEILNVDRFVQVRVAAALALTTYSNNTSINALKEALNRDSSSEVRLQALSSLRLLNSLELEP